MKNRAIIGIEISADEIRGAYVKASGGIPQLAGVASVPTTPGSVDAEGMVNVPEVGEAIRRVCAQLDPKASHVVVGVTGGNLVARVMEIPPVPDPDVRAVLRGEMDHYRILPAGQSAFDFYRLPEPPKKDTEVEEEPVDRVLLMGAEERLVSGYRAVVDAANMNVLAVEPGSIAILRALFPMLRAENAVATVILSKSGTDIFITQEGDLQFYRRIDTGISELHVQQGLAGPAESPQPGRGGLLISSEDDEEEVDNTPAPVPTAADPFNRQAISLLMTEVQRSIDYYVREFPPSGEKIVVRFAIDSPDATDLFPVLAQSLRSEAEMASAMDTLSVDPAAMGAVMGAEGFKYTVAVGLALRGAGGEYAAAPTLDLGVGDSIIVERRMAPKYMIASLAASGAILVGTIAAAIVVGYSISKANIRLSQNQTELKALTAEHAAKVAKLERQKTLVDAIHMQDKPIREAIDFLSGAVARRAAMTSLALDNSGVISLSGEALTTKAIADIMDTINMSPTLEPVRLTLVQRLREIDGAQGLKFDLQTSFIKSFSAAAATPTAPGANGAPAGQKPSGGS